MKADMLFNQLLGALDEDLIRYRSSVGDHALASDSFDHGRLFAASRLPLGLRKKFRGTDGMPSSDSSNLRALRAVELFEQMNSHCLDMNQRFINKGLSNRANIVIEEARAFLDNLFSHGDATWTFSLREAMDNLRPGPGSNRGAKDETLYTKMFGGPLSYSCEGIYRLYKSFVDQNPSMQEAEEIRRLKHLKDDKVLPSKLTTVPKTDVIDRVIMVEPTVNTLLQLGTEHVLRQKLWSAFRIDLETQPDVNRELARLGSLEKADSYGMRWATIDLKSASDTISLELAKSLLPRSVFEWLKMISCRECELPDGSILPLHMMSTMGNGTTFPLQTLLFGAILHACISVCGYRRLHKIGKLKYDFSVFGDDIICDASIYAFVCDILEELGFIVNREKSFSSGPFRESCGTDWYYGYDVRPVYCENLSSIQDIISLVNRLNRWSAKHGIGLPKSISCLVQAIPKESRYLVPNYESDDAGIHVPFEVIAELSRESFPFRPGLDGKRLVLQLRCPSTDCIVYRHFSPEKRRRSYWLMSYQRGTRPQILREKPGINLPGLFQTILAGHVSGTFTHMRLQRVNYQGKWAYTPGWGDPWHLGGQRVHWKPSYGYWTMLVRVNMSSFM